MRTIIIGDIHGCSGALDELLAQTAPVPGRDRLVFLGDLFDRGPDSFGVWRRMKALAEAFGDHQATVDSFGRAGLRMEDAVPWLKENARLFWKADGFQCVHAGLMVDPPEVNDLETLVHSHEIVPMNRYAGPLTVTGHIALEKATWFAGDGETAEELPEGVLTDLPDRGVICIDTGCGKGGTLTAMETDGQRFTLRSAPEA